MWFLRRRRVIIIVLFPRRRVIITVGAAWTKSKGTTPDILIWPRFGLVSRTI